MFSKEGISQAVLIFAIVGHLMNDVNFGVKSGHSIPGGIVCHSCKDLTHMWMKSVVSDQMTSSEAS